MVRYKNRYTVVQLNTLKDNNLDFKITNRELQLSVLKAVKKLHGDFGIGSIRTFFKVHYCNPTTKIIIFKTRHGPHKFLSSAIPFVNELRGKLIKLSTLYTGASLFQCYTFIQNYQKDLLRRLSGAISEANKEKIFNVTGVLKFDKSEFNT